MYNMYKLQDRKEKLPFLKESEKEGKGGGKDGKEKGKKKNKGQDKEGRYAMRQDITQA